MNKDYKKLYEEAFERARKLNSGEDIKAPSDCTLCKFIFPELKESEDERMLNQLHSWMKEFGGAEEYTEKVYNWIKRLLEKRGEQNNLLHFDEAEKEKNDFVSGQFIECRKSFNEFKELESYWLEYVGDDTYIGRSDSILNQKFHITPRQLFTLFTHEHCPKEEKQSEQKPTDKTKPKFKVDDVIVSDYCMGKIIAITNNAYLLDNGQGIPFSCEHNAHLWTIQDAKEGDVLYCKKDNVEFIVMYQGTNTHNYIDSYCRYNSKSGFNTYITGVLNAKLDFIIPANKEQRDLLFQKMKEAGYEWDAEKKELKKIEQKPSWSEEDETILNALIESLQGKVRCFTNKDYIDWLKSLKPHWKPSEEQMNELRRIAFHLGNSCLSPYSDKNKELVSLYKDLKNFKI